MTSPAFRAGLVALASRLKADPNWIAAVMARESGFNPAALNPLSHAAGLIQFMPSTAHALGTSTAELLTMSAEDQLAYVEAFYHPWIGKLHNAGDAYMAAFMPRYVGKPGSTVLFTAPSIGYTQNRSLDRNSDGIITVGDVTALVNRTIAEAQTRLPIEGASERHYGDGGPFGFLLMFLFSSIALWGAKQRAKR